MGGAWSGQLRLLGEGFFGLVSLGFGILIEEIEQFDPVGTDPLGFFDEATNVEPAGLNSPDVAVHADAEVQRTGTTATVVDPEGSRDASTGWLGCVEVRPF